MKHPLAIIALALAPAGAFANTYVERTYAPDGRLIATYMNAGTDAIHAGADNMADQRLAEDVALAIASEPALHGATVTVAAHNGRVSLSGSAESLDQAHRAEQVAGGVAGVASVSGTLDPQGG